MELRTDSKRWTVVRVAGREVFVAPGGHEYVRATPDSATVALAFPALGPSAALLLRPGSVDGLRAARERTERRIARRERARAARNAPKPAHQETP